MLFLLFVSGDFITENFTLTFTIVLIKSCIVVTVFLGSRKCDQELNTKNIRTNNT